MELNKSKGAPPLYYQLKELLEEKIANGEYPVGSMLPTEQELEKRYSLSRVTVRQALNELTTQGLILRKRGNGTIVQAEKLLDEQLETIKSFTEEMKERGMRPGTPSFQYSMEAASKEVAQHLQIQPGEKVCKLERVRSGNNVPIVVFVTFFAKKYESFFSNCGKTDSLYALLRENGVVLTRTSDRYTAGLAGKEIASKLGISAGSPVLIRTRVSYDSKGKIVEYSKCYYNSILYSCNVEMQARI